MGCGTSHGKSVVNPQTSEIMTSHEAWNGTNGNLKPIVIKQCNDSVTTGVQANLLSEVRNKASQTESFIFVEDEWEAFLESHEKYEGLDIIETQVQTDDDFQFVTIENHGEEVDVGVQVRQNVIHKATQTNKGERKIVLTTADFESQTDPVMRAFAANAADSDANILFAIDTSSPIAHIEKELSGLSARRNNAVHCSIARLLQDIEDDFEDEIEKKDASVQTDNDPITDEAPEFAAKPPPCKKKEMIPNMAIFCDTDKRALEASESSMSSLRNLVNYLVADSDNDLLKVRSFFRWISNNIKYDYKYMETKMTAEEVFEKREGVCKDYSKLFNEMCKFAGIRSKRLQGFAKGYDYRPGYKFQPGKDIPHSWNAVYMVGAWRLIDTTWGSGYTDFAGKFQRKLNEHFFLPDPEVLIWTHFPYDEFESDYSRWQLIDKPLTLDEFNSLPKVTPFFFEFNLRLRSRPQNPLTFRVQTEIKVGSPKPMRFKFKLYSADDMENPSLNNYVFCQMKEERLVGSFAISPPTEGRYFFKLYARPEWEMYDDTTLRNVMTFILDCVKSRRYIQPFPLNEVPWGPTQIFYDYGMKLINQSSPVMVTWGNKRRLTIQTSENMLMTHQVFDANASEIDIPGMIQREDKDRRINFYILPSRTGYFKLMLFAMPKPKQKGKWKLPLVATFLIDCKQTKNGHDEDIPVPSSKRPEKRKIKVTAMRL